MNKEIKTSVIGGIFAVIAAVCTAVISCYATITASGINKIFNPGPKSSASIIIYDELGSDQISETIDLYIDGTKRGSVIVDQDRTEDSMTITMPVGRYSYMITAEAVFSDENTYYGTGQGIVEIADGKEYDIVSSFSGSTWLITLVER